MPGRLNEFALGSTYRREEDGPLHNAATETGNNLDSNVRSAVDEHDWAREHAAYRREMDS